MHTGVFGQGRSHSGMDCTLMTTSWPHKTQPTGFEGDWMHPSLAYFSLSEPWARHCAWHRGWKWQVVLKHPARAGSMKTSRISERWEGNQPRGETSRWWKQTQPVENVCRPGGGVVIRLYCFCLPGDFSWFLITQGGSQGFPGSPPFPHWPCGHAHTCTHTWTHAHPAGPSLPSPLSGAWSPVPLSLL